MPEELRRELAKGDVAAVLHVESHHTVQYGWVKLAEVVRLAGEFNVPVIVDGAAQDQRLHELINAGAGLVLTSAHKYLCSTTAGIVAGRKELVDAVYLQNKGIGRPMKAGQEAIIGAMAAMQYRIRQDIQAWTAEQDRKVAVILDRLRNTPGFMLSVDPDPNGCPFSRVRLTMMVDVAGPSIVRLRDSLQAGNPAIYLRAHHIDEGYVNIDAIELTDDEITIVCERIHAILGG
jgi:uncharacterized pyridoxal phosphate-dependent enzyme